MFEHGQKHVFGLIDTGIDINVPNRDEILKEFPIPKFRENRTISLAKPGMTITTTVMITDCELAETKKGDPMLKMKVHDSDGSYSALIFNKPNVSLKAVKEEVIDKHQFIDIEAEVGEFPPGSGKKNLIISGLTVDTDKKRTADAYFAYLPKCKANMEDIIVEMYLMLDTLEEPYRSVAINGLKEHWDKFVVSPAAKRHHHNYIYGLLEHTWGLLRIGYLITSSQSKDIVSMCSKLQADLTNIGLKELKKVKETKEKSPYVYGFSELFSHTYWIMDKMVQCMLQQDHRNINRGMVLSAIIWHDMGKIDEYSLEGGIQRHPITGTSEHRVIGPLLFQRFMDKQEFELDIKLYWQYMNIMSSHHGKVEWGSPTMPDTLEGWAVHFVDYIDSKFQGKLGN